jgi:hypothetical protein
MKRKEAEGRLRKDRGEAEGRGGEGRPRGPERRPRGGRGRPAAEERRKNQGKTYQYTNQPSPGSAPKNNP